MQQQYTQQQTHPPPQRITNSERLAQWRAAAERSGNQRLLDTVDILETLYANESTRPPTPPVKERRSQ